MTDNIDQRDNVLDRDPILKKDIKMRLMMKKTIKL